MPDSEKFRSRARAALEGYFRKRSYPRLVLSLILALTGLVGFGVSYELLHAGVYRMWIRYPVAVLTAYGVMLGLIRLWIEVEQRRFDPEDPSVREAIQRSDERDLIASPAAAPGGKKGGWGVDSLDGCMNLDGCVDAEGCVFLIIGGVVVGLVAVLAITLAGAPVLVAEVFLDAFLIGALYRKLRIAARENWLSTAVRKTWKSAAITAVLIGLGGATLQYIAPGARSIGQAIHQCWQRWR